MSIFTQGMNLASQPAMDQMAETIWLHGSLPLQGIFDPVEQTTARTAGGRKQMAETVIYLKRLDISNNGIKKGDKITLQHGNDLVKVRIQGVHDDGTDLLTLTCGPVLTGTVPRR